MGLFSSRKSSTSTTNNQTNINERALSNVDYSDDGGTFVNILDSSGASVSFTDQGAVDRAFDFGNRSLNFGLSALDFSEDALDRALDFGRDSLEVTDDAFRFVGGAFDSALDEIASNTDRAISASERASRGELSQLFNQYGQYAFIALAVFAVARAFR